MKRKPQTQAFQTNIKYGTLVVDRLKDMPLIIDELRWWVFVIQFVTTFAAFRNDLSFPAAYLSFHWCPTLSNHPVRRSLSLATHSSSFPSSHFLPRLSPCHPVLLSPGQKNAAAKNTNHVDCGIGTRLGAQTILHGSVRTCTACLALSLLYRIGALHSPPQASAVCLLNTDVLY